MKIINIILTLLLFVFCVLFFLMDTYSYLPINTWVSSLYSAYTYSGDGLYSTLFSLNISLALTIIGIAFAIASLILSKYDITFTAYMKYVSKIDPVLISTFLVFLSITVSLFTTYLNFTYLVEIWLKLSLMYPVFFVIIVTINVTRIESKDKISKTLLTLMLSKKDYIGFFNEVYKPLNKENLLASLSDFFFDFANNTKDKNIVFEYYTEINNQLQGNEQ